MICIVWSRFIYFLYIDISHLRKISVWKWNLGENERIRGKKITSLQYVIYLDQLHPICNVNIEERIFNVCCILLIWIRTLSSSHFYSSLIDWRGIHLNFATHLTCSCYSRTLCITLFRIFFHSSQFKMLTNWNLFCHSFSVQFALCVCVCRARNQFDYSNCVWICFLILSYHIVFMHFVGREMCFHVRYCKLIF